MATAPRLEQNDFPDPPYADELRRVTLSVPFDRKLEPEYVRSHLIHSRTLIRAAVVLGMLLLVLRGVDQTVKASWNAALLGYFGLVAASSAVLTGLAWSRSFERLYL